MRKCPDEFGIYNGMIILKFPKHMLIDGGGFYSTKDCCAIDSCLVEEIKYLWSLGIHTMGCCCGHGINNGYIQVLNNEDTNLMIELAYIPIKSKPNAFIPKSKHI